MDSVSPARETFASRVIVLPEDDVNTDRIIPSKYLKLLSFDSLGSHVFAGDRANAAAVDKVHPFDAPENQQSRILISGANFGAGSSREAAPQALNRWGIGVVLAVSFGEIFRGNSAAIGLPCLEITGEDYREILGVFAADPTLDASVSLIDMAFRVGKRSWPVHIDEIHRTMFRTGRWDTLSLLTEGLPQVRQVAARLPYLNGWIVE